LKNYEVLQKLVGSNVLKLLTINHNFVTILEVVKTRKGDTYMKQKDKYTLYELFDSLPIPLTELSRLSGKSHGTLTRIRDGEPARKSTINKLLMVLSDVYNLDLSTENVEGIILEGRQQRPAQIDEKPQVSTMPISATTTQEKEPQKRNVEPKRAYERKKDTGLPDGCMSATEFGLAHGIRRETFRDHMNIGLGKGLIHGPDVPEDGTVLVKDYVRAEERNKRVRKDGTIEKERFLTPSQQAEAIAFWRRHDVSFSQCDRPDCPCHQ
jgi:hypothetical protein